MDYSIYAIIFSGGIVSCRQTEVFPQWLGHGDA